MLIDDGGMVIQDGIDDSYGDYAAMCTCCIFYELLSSGLVRLCMATTHLPTYLMHVGVELMFPCSRWLTSTGEYPLAQSNPVV